MLPSPSPSKRLCRLKVLSKASQSERVRLIHAIDADALAPLVEEVAAAQHDQAHPGRSGIEGWEATEEAKLAVDLGIEAIASGITSVPAHARATKIGSSLLADVRTILERERHARGGAPNGSMALLRAVIAECEATWQSAICCHSSASSGRKRARPGTNGDGSCTGDAADGAGGAAWKCLRTDDGQGTRSPLQPLQPSSNASRAPAPDAMQRLGSPRWRRVSRRSDQQGAEAEATQSCTSVTTSQAASSGAATPQLASTQASSDGNGALVASTEVVPEAGVTSAPTAVSTGG